MSVTVDSRDRNTRPRSLGLPCERFTVTSTVSVTGTVAVIVNLGFVYMVVRSDAPILISGLTPNRLIHHVAVACHSPSRRQEIAGRPYSVGRSVHSDLYRLLLLRRTVILVIYRGAVSTIFVILILNVMTDSLAVVAACC